MKLTIYTASLFLLALALLVLLYTKASCIGYCPEGPCRSDMRCGLNCKCLFVGESDEGVCVRFGDWD